MEKQVFDQTYTKQKLSELANGDIKFSGPLTNSKLFKFGSQSDIKLELVKAGQVIQLIDPQKRGEDGQEMDNEEEMHSFLMKAVHLKGHKTIKADDYQGKKGFGEGYNELEAIDAVISRKQNQIRLSIDYTIEHLLIGAINGVLVKKDGTTKIVDLFDKFDVKKTTIKLDPNKGKLALSIKAAKRVITKKVQAAGAGMITGWAGICGHEAYSILISAPETQKAVEKNAPPTLMTGFAETLKYQNVEWQEYDVTVNGKDLIPADAVRLIPIVDGLLCVDFCPADYEETVNTEGLPFYSSKEQLPHDRGHDMELQSNPMVYCSMPDAIGHCTFEALVEEEEPDLG